jgi:WD40 repeat protein
MTVPGTLLPTYQSHSERVAAVAWSPDGSRIASGNEDWMVQVWVASYSEDSKNATHRER